VKTILKTDIVYEIYCILKFKIQIRIDPTWATPKQAVGYRVFARYHCSMTRHAKAFSVAIPLMASSPQLYGRLVFLRLTSTSCSASSTPHSLRQTAPFGPTRRRRPTTVEAAVTPCVTANLFAITKGLIMHQMP
jgi:hypothetical protein